MDCNSPGSSVHRISQARILEWVAISSSRGSSWPRNQTCVSCIFCIDRQILLPLSHQGSQELVSSVQFSSVAQSCPTLWDPMNCSTPGLPVHHQLPEFTQTHVHRVGDAIQPSHPMSSPSPPAPDCSQHQSFPISQPFTWGGQSTGVSALASFLPRTPGADLLLLYCFKVVNL